MSIDDFQLPTQLPASHGFSQSVFTRRVQVINRKPVNVFGAIIAPDKVTALQLDLIPASNRDDNGPVWFLKCFVEGGELQLWRSDRPADFVPEIIHPLRAFYHAQILIFGQVIHVEVDEYAPEGATKQAGPRQDGAGDQPAGVHDPGQGNNPGTQGGGPAQTVD